MDLETGRRLQLLRKRSSLSIRELAARSGVTASMISYVERGKHSISLTTLQKLLSALGTDLTSFFAAQGGGGKGPVLPREQMQVVSDRERTYTILLPKRAGVRLEMFDEELRPGKTRAKPEFETLNCDVAGYVLLGGLVLEVEGEPPQTLRPGDAFYVPKGTAHRGYAADGQPVRLISVCYPPRY
jgi:transcriptional regulator with XRE-family HTH domain